MKGAEASDVASQQMLVRSARFTEISSVKLLGLINIMELAPLLARDVTQIESDSL